ncbi:MAG: TerB family tellurite resistance protein [Alkalimonas sp.]|nr:TerB family tellurite resistance protein [Alkalimonas sp.]
MFQLFKRLLESSDTPHTQDCPALRLVDEAQLMSVVLMLEVAAADFQDPTEEHDLVLRYLQDEFKLSDADAEVVFQRAKELSADAVCLHRFTSKMTDYSYPQRLDFIEQLWRIAYHDGQLDPHEEAMLRKVADLLFIRHGDFIQCKLAAQPDQA